MLTPAEVAATVDTIAGAQRPDGLVPWVPGGVADPWNHVEAAMALVLGGRRAEADRAYGWLASSQHPGGSWWNRYVDGEGADRRIDTNACAYVATGAWHHFLATGDHGFLETMFPVVDAAVGFSLAHQRPDGAVTWSVEPGGTPADHALLTASSSIHLSVRCAIAAAWQLGLERPEWELAAGRLGAALVHRPGAFAPKDRYAMDWYYPVLCGTVRGRAARTRLLAGWGRFVMDGLGVRCVSDQPWVTAAETAECAMALDACGLGAEARLLLEWTRHLRHDDGSYWTGCAHPQCVRFPGGERSTYTAAAVVLATHALDRTAGPASALFRGASVPDVAPAGLDRAQHPLPLHGRVLCHWRHTTRPRTA